MFEYINFIICASHDFSGGGMLANCVLNADKWIERLSQ